MPLACIVDDSNSLDGVRELLATVGWQCVRVDSSSLEQQTLLRQRVDLALVNVTRDSTLEERVLSWIGDRGFERAPIVLVCDRASPDQVVRALDAGADDFISGPAQPHEVLARLKVAAGRRLKRPQAQTLSLGEFSLDSDSARLWDRGVRVRLTPREFAMAWLLFSNEGKTLSRQTLALVLWGVDADIAHHTLEQHIYQLRRKLKLGKARGITIQTVYSGGYRLRLEAPAVQAEKGVVCAFGTAGYGSTNSPITAHASARPDVAAPWKIAAAPFPVRHFKCETPRSNSPVASSDA